MRELAGPRGFPLGVPYQFAIVSRAVLMVNGLHLVLHFPVGEPFLPPGAVSSALDGDVVRIIRCARDGVIPSTVGDSGVDTLLHLDGTLRSAGAQTTLDLASGGQALVAA